MQQLRFYLVCFLIATACTARSAELRIDRGAFGILKLHARFDPLKTYVIERTTNFITWDIVTDFGLNEIRPQSYWFSNIWVWADSEVGIYRMQTQVKPALQAKEPMLEAVVGQTVILKPIATGYPMNTRWFGPTGELEVNRSALSLTLTNVAESASGKYRVDAQNSLGGASATWTLSVYPPNSFAPSAGAPALLAFKFADNALMPRGTLMFETTTSPARIPFRLIEPNQRVYISGNTTYSKVSGNAAVYELQIGSFMAPGSRTLTGVVKLILNYTHKTGGTLFVEHGEERQSGEFETLLTE